jgi:stage II sporulation protein D
MKLDDYLKGVLTAEMPASYHIEALKAQAVVARSYTYNKYIKGKSSTDVTDLHNDADICTSSEHCQGYLTIEEANAKWGDAWSDTYYKKIEQAIKETDGEILEYNSQPVNAVFHSSSYGRTENAKDVWGSDVLYLKSVESKGDKTQLETQSTFTHERFIKLMKENFPDIVFQGDVAYWIKNFKYSEGGSVLSVDVGNKQ